MKENIKNIKSIWLEVSNVELYKKQPLASDVEVFMKKNNFHLAKSKFQGNFGDQLYLNKTYFKTHSFFRNRIQFYFKINKSK